MTYVVSVYCEAFNVVYEYARISTILTIPVAMLLKERMKTNNERVMFRHMAKTRSPANTTGERSSNDFYRQCNRLTSPKERENVADDAFRLSGRKIAKFTLVNDRPRIV